MQLSNISELPDDYPPSYVPEKLGVGIVHLGLGSFHKAHQATLTHQVLQQQPDAWRIFGVSLRSKQPKKDLLPQNCLFTLVSKGQGGAKYEVIASIADAACLVDDFDKVLANLASEKTKIVTITVTEKAYGLDRLNNGCDETHSAISHDLENPSHPVGVIGLLVLALKRRYDDDIEPFTVLCCDNLPENGKLLRSAVIDFAFRNDKDLAVWISANVAFPSTMVDRITPAPTPETKKEVQQVMGILDNAAVETEEFCQWVIEDNFPSGRPNWDLAGAIFTDDVAKFERMKLRMLNGSHSMLAYTGFHCGLQYVRDVMNDASMVKLITRHLRAALATLDEIDGIDFNEYANELLQRFRNPSIAHETFQIAMDGSEKMPQRIFDPAFSGRLSPELKRPYAFATAAWLRHISGSTHDCDEYILRDPISHKLSEIDLNSGPKILVRQLEALGLINNEMAEDTAYWIDVSKLVEEMLVCSMVDVVNNETSFSRFSNTL